MRSIEGQSPSETEFYYSEQTGFYETMDSVFSNSYIPVSALPPIQNISLPQLAAQSVSSSLVSTGVSVASAFDPTGGVVAGGLAALANAISSLFGQGRKQADIVTTAYDKGGIRNLIDSVIYSDLTGYSSRTVTRAKIDALKA